MVMRLKRQSIGNGLVQQVRERSGVDVNLCYQCRKCSCGCTVSGIAQSPPSELIRYLQLGAGDELLDNDLIWACASCETCYARCPMGIDTVALMDALRSLAIEKGAAVPEGNVPLLNRSLLGTVGLFGRTWDVGLITRYKMGTSSYLQDADKVPMMLKKRKIALLPSLGGDRKTVRRIFKSVREAKEGSR